MAVNDDIRIAADASPSESSPSDDTLYDEIRTAKTRGVGNAAQPLTDLAGLLSIARTISSKDTDDEKIEDALRQAIEHRGGSVKALEALFGLAADTRGLGVKARREKAAKLDNYKGQEYFRTRFETPLLMGIATHLSFLLREHRWVAEREALLTAYSRSKVKADQLQHPTQTIPDPPSQDTYIWTTFRCYDQMFGARMLRIRFGMEAWILDYRKQDKILYRTRQHDQNPNLKRPILFVLVVGGTFVSLSLLGTYEGVRLLM